VPNRDPDLLEAAVFGKEVEQFLRGNIGAYLIKLAKEQSDAALEKLKSTDPYDHQAIFKLQMGIKVADSIVEWLGEAIAQGMQAQAALEDE
jgi:hypothetical protein